jgi:hypothetical protein
LCDKLPLEKVQIKFCRYILGVHRKATNIAVRAELGLYPVLVELLIHSAKYWIQLCDTGLVTWVKKAYLDSYILKDKSHTWATHIQKLWTHFSLNEIWNNHGTRHRHKVIHLLRTGIHNQYNSLWESALNMESSKLRTYKLFKVKPSLENYLCSCNISRRQEFTKLRISAHSLRIEIGRYTVPRKTPVENRTCQLCNSNCIEDERHFVLNCPFFNTEREVLFTALDLFTDFQSLDAD